MAKLFKPALTWGERRCGYHYILKDGKLYAEIRGGRWRVRGQVQPDVRVIFYDADGEETRTDGNLCYFKDAVRHINATFQDEYFKQTGKVYSTEFKQ